ncbi:MAG: type I restriction enzyme HsdR N-terminal domain-containing protein [Caldilineales bacterium]|nr:type I restriction enzyme HsdR N-terminal domain-containing protein [Caldilineales bacterium]
MPPAPFYEIHPNAYLFQKSATPEEEVRQWVAFELLSGYGFHINNIEFEKPVKVGRRTHYADIVVFNNHKPYIVIECKRRDESKIADGLKQAVSYATAYEIRAEFAVCSNGSNWQVMRNINDNWVKVTDIPRIFSSNTRRPIHELFYEINHLELILYWLHRPVPAKYAQIFLSNLQDILLRCQLSIAKTAIPNMVGMT